MPATLLEDGTYDDPEEWDNEVPQPLAERYAVELRALGWNVVRADSAGVEIRGAGGEDTGVWMARGGLWTGIGDHRGRCENPIEVYAEPRDPEGVAQEADRIMRELGVSPTA